MSSSSHSEPGPAPASADTAFTLDELVKTFKRSGLFDSARKLLFEEFQKSDAKDKFEEATNELLKNELTSRNASGDGRTRTRDQLSFRALMSLAERQLFPALHDKMSAEVFSTESLKTRIREGLVASVEKIKEDRIAAELKRVKDAEEAAAAEARRKEGQLEKERLKELEEKNRGDKMDLDDKEHHDKAASAPGTKISKTANRKRAKTVSIGTAAASKISSWKASVPAKSNDLKMSPVDNGPLERTDDMVVDKAVDAPVNTSDDVDIDHGAASVEEAVGARAKGGKVETAQKAKKESKEEKAEKTKAEKAEKTKDEKADRAKAERAERAEKAKLERAEKAKVSDKAKTAERAKAAEKKKPEQADKTKKAEPVDASRRSGRTTKSNPPSGTTTPPNVDVSAAASPQAATSASAATPAAGTPVRPPRPLKTGMIVAAFISSKQPKKRGKVVCLTVKIKNHDPDTGMFTVEDLDPDSDAEDEPTAWELPASQIRDFLRIPAPTEPKEKCYAIYQDEEDADATSTIFYEAIVQKVDSSGGIHVRYLENDGEDGGKGVLGPTQVFRVDNFVRYDEKIGPTATVRPEDLAKLPSTPAMQKAALPPPQPAKSQKGKATAQKATTLKSRANATTQAATAGSAPSKKRPPPKKREDDSAAPTPKKPKSNKQDTLASLEPFIERRRSGRVKIEAGMYEIKPIPESDEDDHTGKSSSGDGGGKGIEGEKAKKHEAAAGEKGKTPEADGNEKAKSSERKDAKVGERKKKNPLERLKGSGLLDEDISDLSDVADFSDSSDEGSPLKKVRRAAKDRKEDQGKKDEEAKDGEQKEVDESADAGVLKEDSESANIPKLVGKGAAEASDHVDTRQHQDVAMQLDAMVEVAARRTEQEPTHEGGHVAPMQLDAGTDHQEKKLSSQKPAQTNIEGAEADKMEVDDTESFSGVSS
ncbi:hypothetical protein HK101_007460 [Irineochytrium annulatum]|nr:hypothetical protein HK101_007460 [Irineochytrium annulatum]